MDDSQVKRWLVKDREGRVRGPHTTDDVLRSISKGELSGDEQIALYPGAKWMAISNNHEFYDKLLEELEGERKSHGPDINSRAQADAQPSQSFDPEVSAAAVEPTTEKKPPPKQGRAERVSHKEEAPPKPHAHTEEVKSAPPFDVIELKQRKKIIKKAKAKKSVIPGLLFVLSLVAVIYVFFFAGSESKDKRIHLLAPRSSQSPQSKEFIDQRVLEGLNAFNLDSFAGYLRAQGALVQAIEGDAKRTEAMSLLCLTYLELWPYSFQDSSDVQAMGTVSQMANLVAATSIESSTCRMTELLTSGKLDEAAGLTESVLETYGGTGLPPTAFYYFKAKLLQDKNEFASAIGYAQSTQQLWPSWLKLFALEAELHSQMGNHQKAAARYRDVLKVNPNHRTAQIELGLIEYFKINNYQEGKTLLEQAAANVDQAPNDVLSRGFLGLAEIALKEKHSKDALSYAKKSYGVNAANARAKEIIIQLGGKEHLKNVRIVDTQLIFEGDQLVREGDFNGAQAFYKEAFAANPKNGIAAMKAGEALWELSLSAEAIEWLNKAIIADPNLIEAYIQLAEYFTERFEFASAAQVLAKAREQAPQSYKVFRGYALVELKRNSAESAASYAEKAIQLYGADVESYVILAKARMLSRDYAKAFSAAARAIEIDQNNKEAQITYAQALSGARGGHLGIEHLRRLVETYPTIVEYRLALGVAYLNDQSYDNAAEVFKQVIRLEERPKKAYIELGKTYAAQQRYDEAIKAHFKAAELDPADVEPLFRVALLYLEAKRPSDAIRQLQRVLLVNKDYPLVNYYMGRAAFMMESYDQAINMANAEKGKNPSLADPYILAAEVYAARKQYSLCAGEYQQVVKLRRQGSDIYVKMARCYRMSGNLDAAAAMINEANNQESGNPEVWKEQGAIFEMRGESVKAISAYNQYLVLRPNAPDRSDIETRILALSK